MKKFKKCLKTCPTILNFREGCGDKRALVVMTGYGVSWVGSAALDKGVWGGCFMGAGGRGLGGGCIACELGRGGMDG